MGMPELFVAAVLVEGCTKSEVAREYGVSRRRVIMSGLPCPIGEFGTAHCGPCHDLSSTVAAKTLAPVTQPLRAAAPPVVRSRYMAEATGPALTSVSV
jgi:hypothetical protein